MDRKKLQELADETLKQVKNVSYEAFRSNLQNEQWFLNWQDDLNAESIK